MIIILPTRREILSRKGTCAQEGLDTEAQIYEWIKVATRLHRLYYHTLILFLIQIFHLNTSNSFTNSFSSHLSLITQV